MMVLSPDLSIAVISQQHTRTATKTSFSNKPFLGLNYDFSMFYLCLKLFYPSYPVRVNTPQISCHGEGLSYGL